MINYLLFLSAETQPYSAGLQTRSFISESKSTILQSAAQTSKAKITIVYLSKKEAKKQTLLSFRGAEDETVTVLSSWKSSSQTK